MEQTKTNNDRIEITLGDLLNKIQMKELIKLLQKQDWNNIRIFLNAEPTKSELEKKGVLADYLYYYLQYKFKTGDK